MGHTIAIICAVIAVLVTPIYLYLMARGVRSIDGVRRTLQRPVRRDR